MLGLFLNSLFYSIVYAHASTTIFDYSSFLIDVKIKCKFCSFVVLIQDFWLWAFLGPWVLGSVYQCPPKNSWDFYRECVYSVLSMMFCSFQVQILHFFQKFIPKYFIVGCSCTWKFLKIILYSFFIISSLL